jgi:hypothetical protein
METRSSRSFGAGPILGLVGGALLIIGSLLTWATVSINLGRFASGLGVDPDALPPTFAGAFGEHQAFAGTNAGAGKIALICGVIALVIALIIGMGSVGKVGGVILLIAGVVGGGFATLFTVSPQVSVVDEVGDYLRAIGFQGDFKSFFDISVGVGAWTCILGGVLVIVAGILSLRTKAPATTEIQAVGPSTSMGTGVPTSSMDPAGGTSQPTVPPVPPPPPPMDAPDPGTAPPSS